LSHFRRLSDLWGVQVNIVSASIRVRGGKNGIVHMN
jgi:hypothetical protein